MKNKFIITIITPAMLMLLVLCCNENQKNNTPHVKVELEYPDAPDLIDMRKVLDKTEKSLPGIDLAWQYLDDDTMDFDYILGYYIQLRLQDKKNPQLELIWRRTQSRERRILILLVHYPFIVKRDLYVKGRPEYRNLEAWSGRELDDRLRELDFVEKEGGRIAAEIDKRIIDFQNKNTGMSKDPDGSGRTD